MKKILTQLRRTIGWPALIAAAFTLSLPMKAEPYSAPLFGNIVANGDWSEPTSQVGIYQLTADGNMQQVFCDSQMQGMAGVFINDKYYVCSPLIMGPVLLSTTMYVYDVDAKELDVTIGFSGWSNVAVGYTYDSGNDAAYALTYNQNTALGYVLNKFDYETLTYTPICDLENAYLAFCIDGEGRFYGIGQDGWLCRIDETTGESHKILDTQFKPEGSQSAVWSPRDGKILWAAHNQAESRLMSIDVASGTPAIEEICSYNGVQVLGLYTTDPMVSPDAPSAPQDMEIDYAETGSTVATVSCTAPVTSMDGGKLQGGMTACVKVDDEEPATFPAMAGEPFSQEIDLASEGKHKITLWFQNDSGKGALAIGYTYTGFDTPTAVAGLQYTLSDTGEFAMTWTAPVGINGGGLAPLSYEIYKNGNLVATVTETRYEEKLDGELQSYSYSVIPVAGNRRGESAGIESFMFGDAVSLPYEQHFADESSMDFFTVLDANGDGVSWLYDSLNKAAFYRTNTQGVDADDYLIAPKVNLEKGHVYKIQFSTWVTDANTTEQLSVVVAKGMEKVDMEAADAVGGKLEISNTYSDKRTVELEYTAAESGIRYFAFHCTTMAGGWILNLTDIRIEDLGNAKSPSAVSDLEVATDSDGELEVTVSFVTPDRTVDGSALGELDKIEIARDGKVIKRFDKPGIGQKLEYVDTEISQTGYLTYSVWGTNANGSGEQAEKQVYVGALSVPFYIDLTDKSGFDKMTMENSTGDGWKYNAEIGCLYFSTLQGGGNSYAVSPLVELNKGQMFQVQFSASTVTGNDIVVRIHGRNGLAPDSQWGLIAAEVVREPEVESFNEYFQVPDDGYYAIAFEVSGSMLTPDDGLCISSLSVTPGPDILAPKAVTGLTVTPAPEGGLAATLQFTLPTLNLSGGLLDGKIGAKVYNQNGQVVGSLPMDKQPGKTVTMEATALQGINNFIVVAENEHGEGGRAELAAFCGVDIPMRVNNLQGVPSSDNMSVTLQWDAPERGFYNGWFDASQLKYHIKQYNEADGSVTAIGETTELHYTVEAESDKLAKYTYIVTASTGAGESKELTMFSNVLGTPYRLPLKEYNTGGNTSTGPWVTKSLYESTYWSVVSEIPIYDAFARDGGFFLCADSLDRSGMSYLYIPKFSPERADNPCLRFSSYRYFSSHAMLYVEASVDEVNYKEIARFSLSDIIDGRNGWEANEVDLSAYKDAPWLSLRISALLDSGKEYAMIDNIVIADKADYDIDLQALAAPTSATAGATIQVDATVRNTGLKDATFHLELYNGTDLLYTGTDETLATGVSGSYTLPYTLHAADIAKGATLTVKTICDEQEDYLWNNADSVTVICHQPALPAITSLSGEHKENGNVLLEWDEPEMTPPTGITDDFEEYESFSNSQIGNYQLADLDGQFTTIGGEMSFINQNQPMAFMVFNPAAAGIKADGSATWQAHSGYKYLVSWSSIGSINGDGSNRKNDDWLISPRVQGGSQVEFYAKIPFSYYPEVFEIWYSTTNADVESFEILPGSKTGVETIEWTQFLFTLPDDARYFAIRHTSSSYLLMIDDLAYTADDGSIGLTINGYNVYCNGNKANDQIIADTGCECSTVSASGTYLYQATVVYDQGESIPSNPVAFSIEISGIGNVDAQGLSTYGKSRAIVVKGAYGLQIRIYDADGRMVECSKAENDEQVFPVDQGIYIVTVNGTTVGKVIVR